VAGESLERVGGIGSGEVEEHCFEHEPDSIADSPPRSNKLVTSPGKAASRD
jgi:hypothetical protein